MLVEPDLFVEQLAQASPQLRGDQWQVFFNQIVHQFLLLLR